MNPSVKSDLEIRALLLTCGENLARVAGEQKLLSIFYQEAPYRSGDHSPRKDLVFALERSMEEIIASLEKLDACRMEELKDSHPSVFVSEPDHFRNGTEGGGR